MYSGYSGYPVAQGGAAPQASYGSVQQPHSAVLGGRYFAGVAPGASADAWKVGSADACGAQPPRAQRGGRVNATAVLICLVAPCAEFAAVSAALSLALRQNVPALSFIVVAAAGCAAVACAYTALSTARKRWLGVTMREPFWYVFLGVAMLAAWGAAYWLGETNWLNNVAPYLELQSLDVRFNVDPSTTSGQQLMDVGRVMFAEGSRVDVAHTMGFKNTEQYCVAPIVRGNGTADSFDFWAIGLNCCSPGASREFRCGDYDNLHARGGLRIVREDQRAFYQLAVQQAEAAYGLHVNQPMLFYWMQDPVAELESYKADSQKFFFLGNLSFFAVQLLLVLLGILVVTKL